MPAAARFQRRPYWYAAGLAFSLFMLCVHVAAGFNSAGIGDSWRDLYWATMIARGDAFPLTGVSIYNLLELGPWWFYILAIPVALTGSVVAVTMFVQLLAGTKYLLAWRLGTRFLDARFGLAFTGSLAIAGWSTIPMVLPSHTALIEMTLLLLAAAIWRCWLRLSIVNALLLGLASAACLHAHPTTATYVVVAGAALLIRHRSWPAFGLLALAAVLTALTLAPPLLDATPSATERTFDGYIGTDIAVNAWRRIPALLVSAAVKGAWNGFELMTPWNMTAIHIAWYAYCACTLVALAGLLLLWRNMPRLRVAAAVAAALFVLQATFLVVVRPATPMWMLSTALPPLALLLALGWYGWFAMARATPRMVAMIAFALFVALSIPPFGFFLRDLRSLRVPVGVNPYQNVIDSSDRYTSIAVAFYPARSIASLASSFCDESVVHAQLATVMEQSLGAPIRLGCGHWPELRYGGREGPSKHIAGLLPRAAAASGIAPDRVVAGMALYERVTPIAPAAGGYATHLRRGQFNPDVPSGASMPVAITFDAKGADVPILTNRFSLAMLLKVHAVTADGRPARLLLDENGSQVYRCTDCAPEATVHWNFQLEGNEDKLDLVVLNGAASAAK